MAGWALDSRIGVKERAYAEADAGRGDAGDWWRRRP